MRPLTIGGLILDLVLVPLAVAAVLIDRLARRLWPDPVAESRWRAVARPSRHRRVVVRGVDGVDYPICDADEQTWPCEHASNRLARRLWP